MAQTESAESEIVAERLSLSYRYIPPPPPRGIGYGIRARLPQQRQRDAIKIPSRHYCCDSVTYKRHCDFNSMRFLGFSPQIYSKFADWQSWHSAVVFSISYFMVYVAYDDVMSGGGNCNDEIVV